MHFILWWLRTHGETVGIAQLIKDLQRELDRRAEYAIRFGIHSPAQWRHLRELLLNR